MTNRLEVEQLSSRGVGPVDLALASGECVAISGPSGSGKSLMLRAIADLDPHAGEVRLDGRNCAEYKGHEWRRQVGLLPAEAQWWSDRIGDHFSAIDEAWFVRLGFDAGVLEWEVSRCSTGERQRLGLLRLLLNKPAVLLLDEPTASLDSDNTLAIELLIEEYRNTTGAAVIWVSHSVEQMARVAGRRFRMQQGQMREVPA